MDGTRRRKGEDEFPADRDGVAANRPASGAGGSACQDAGVTEQRFDLVVRNGTIVTPGHREQADVGITGGRIAQLGGDHDRRWGDRRRRPAGDPRRHRCPRAPDVRSVTAQVAALEPGEPVWADDFWTGSLAAIAGGITTIGNMTFALPGESMTQAVVRDMAGAGAEAAVDWFLHPVLTGLGDAEPTEVAGLAAGGHTSIKVFLSNPGFAAGTPGLAEVVAAAGRAGSMTLMHCEDAHMLAADRPRADRGRTRRGPVLPRRADGYAEVTAVDAAIEPGRGRPARRSTSCTCPRRRPGPVPPGPRRGPARLRRDQAAVPAPDQGAVQRARRGQVRRRPAAAGAGRPGRAVARAGRGRRRHAMQRSRAVDAGRQARPCASTW